MSGEQNPQQILLGLQGILFRVCGVSLRAPTCSTLHSAGLTRIVVAYFLAGYGGTQINGETRQHVGFLRSSTPGRLASVWEIAWT